MAVGLAAGQANAILDALCSSIAYSDPAGFFIKLHTGDPGAAGAGNAAGETTRQDASAAFAAASGGAITTDAAITWTNVSTTETLSHISFWSASVAGTFLGSDALDVARAVTAGDTFTIAAGDLDLSITAIAA